MLRPLLLTSALVLGFAGQAIANPAAIGEPLPQLKIEDRGELVLTEKGDVNFEPWSTEKMDLESKVHIVQYMAGRPSAERVMRPFTDALEERAFPEELHEVVTVVNLSDVTMGASGFAVREMQSNKREYPMAVMVADADGQGLQRWGLKPRSVAVFILDEAGKILFFNEGGMNKQEIDQALALIATEVEKRQQPEESDQREAGILPKVLPKALE